MPADAKTSAGSVTDLGHVAKQLAQAQGSLIGVPDPIVISQPEEDAFAALIGDWDPMHNDPRWHAGTSNGPIVLGVHVLARLEHLVHSAVFRDAPVDVEVITTGLTGVRFPAPFPVGASARAEVAIAHIAVRDGGIVLETTHRCAIDGQAKPTMVAQHTAFLTTTPAARYAAQVPAAEPVAIAGIPAGTPIPPAATYDERFFTALAARSGQWLGATPWTSISDREAHAFSLLCDGTGGTGPSPAHPFAGRPIPRLHLLALRAYFSPQVGLPVLTDQSMMAFNYGVDFAHWRGAVLPGTRLRDHVQLASSQARAAGDFLVTTHHVLEAEGDPHGVLVADCKTLYRTAR
jgi:acyl dehydratase